MTQASEITSKERAISKIIATTEAMELFWRQAHGWAPVDAADLLASARLDRQVSFTHTLSDYLASFSSKEAEARQILGYATLRSLCEGALKLFFAVWFQDYRRDAIVMRNKKGKILPFSDISFDRLIVMYSKKVDVSHEDFLRRVQQRGNGIHHFTDRDIGTQKELISDIETFLGFLLDMNSRLPYPDDVYNPARA